MRRYTYLHIIYVYRIREWRILVLRVVPVLVSWSLGRRMRSLRATLARDLSRVSFREGGVEHAALRK